MPKNISLKDEELTSLDKQVTSVISGAIPVYKDVTRESAFKERYGKDVEVAMTVEQNPDKSLKTTTIRFQSKNNKIYVIHEIFDNGDTKAALLCYNTPEKTYQYLYDRFVDAEIHLADLIAMENK